MQYEKSGWQSSDLGSLKANTIQGYIHGIAWSTCFGGKTDAAHMKDHDDGIHNLKRYNEEDVCVCQYRHRGR